MPGIDIQALLAGLIPTTPTGQTGGQTGGGPTSVMPPPPSGYAGQLGALGLNTIPDRNQQLEQQIQQAQLLRRGGAAEKRSSPMGALLGGMGDVAGGVIGHNQEQGFRGQMDANFAKEDAGGQLAANAQDAELTRMIAQLLRAYGTKGQDTEALAAPVPL